MPRYDKDPAPVTPLPDPIAGLDAGTVSALAQEVVRRLAARHASDHQPDAARIAIFCDALATVGGERAAARIAAETARAQGFDAFCAGLLAPAARELGRLWDADRLGFTDVTLATARLLALLRRHAPRRGPAPADRQALFAATPGEDHTIGVTMAAERLRAAGWDIELVVGVDHDALLAQASHSPAAVMGLSLSAERHVLALVRAVLALRVARPDLPLLVVGPDTDWMAAARPAIGADAVATSHDEAREALDRLASPDAD